MTNPLRSWGGGSSRTSAPLASWPPGCRNPGQAAARSIGGIFLFTKDDDLADQGVVDTSVPRDNVVFEAGYFIGLKGKRNVLFIREADSNMPADLGGDIYAFLPDKADIGPIERTLAGFMGAI